MSKTVENVNDIKGAMKSSIKSTRVGSTHHGAPSVGGGGSQTKNNPMYSGGGTSSKHVAHAGELMISGVTGSKPASNAIIHHAASLSIKNK
jgi:hypothetical protein